MNKLLWMLSGGGNNNSSNTTTTDPDALKEAGDQLLEEVWPIISTVLWILTAVLAVVFIIKAITTAMAVMKAADEPQVRQEKLNGFKYLAIGLGVAIVILALANTVIDIIVKSNKGLNNPTSFLF